MKTKEITILLDTIDKINEFIKIMGVQDNDVEVHSGKYIINAKSIMGLFSLDLSTTVTVVCDKGFSDLTVSNLKKFEVKETKV